MTRREPVIANPWLSIALRIVAAAMAILFVLWFTRMTIQMRAKPPAPAVKALNDPRAAPGPAVAGREG